MIFAVVDGVGNIVNRVSGPAGWTPAAGFSAIQEVGTVYEIGGTLIGGVYTPPAARPTTIPNFAPASTYIAGLRRKAAQLRAKGDIQGSIDLILKAAGVPR